MKSIHFLFYLVILFYFSEGKPCPEETRPHKTRCDAYFKCVILPSKKYVWVPIKCDIGLVYEQNLRTCVLPGDDWECNVEQEVNKNDQWQNNDKKFEIFPVIKRKPNRKLLQNQTEVLSNQINKNENEDLNKSTNDIVMVKELSDDSANNFNISEIQFENIEKNENNLNKINEDIESSGDDDYKDDSNNEQSNEYLIEIKENKENDLPISSSSTKADSNLIAHLQRLSQLIDGLKQKYQHYDNTTYSDLRPDQLNAFLAHYNIKSEFDAIETNTEKFQIPNDGKIQPEILTHLLKQQEKLAMDNMPIDNDNGNNKLLSLPIEKLLMENTKTNSIIKIGHNKNKIKNMNTILKRPRFPQFNNNFDDESILMNLVENQKNEPQIPEDALKTVMKLSKEMASNQNTRHVITMNGLFQPLLHQAYYAAPAPELFYHHSPYRRNDVENYYNGILNKDKHNSCNDKMTYSQNKINQNNEDDNYNKLWFPQPTSTTENSVFSEYYDQNLFDSYGNKISDYIEFPPYNDENFATTTTTTTPSPALTSLSFNGNQDAQRRVETSNYFTPSPHLDDSNVNKIVEIDSFSTVPYVYPANRIKSPFDYKLNEQKQFSSRIDSSLSHDKFSNKNQISLPSRHHHHHHKHHHHSQYYRHPMFPILLQVNPETVSIEPNSYKTSNTEKDYNPIDENVKQTVINKNAMNKQEIVNGLLASASTLNLDQVPHDQQDSFTTKINGINGQHQFINLGGNFIDYDVFKNYILPSVIKKNDVTSSSPMSATDNFPSHSFEIISCNSGVRQPNSTDCTKYFICSKKDGRVLSYTCPPYTAFNSETRICDGQTYSLCNPNSISYNNYHLTLSANRKIQMEALKALQEAKRIREEAIKTKNLANLIRLEAQKISENHKNNIKPMDTDISSNQSDEILMINNDENDSTAKPITLINLQPASQYQHPQQYQQKLQQQQQKRKYYCKEGAKIPDQLSIYNYYVCYKTKDGIMHGHKMTCPNGLIFCAKSSMCTTSRKCNVQ